MRTLVLVDGEHYPPVVRAAVEQLPSQFPGAVVVGACLLGGTEKLSDDRLSALGLPVVEGDSPDDALMAALARFSPELVVDLSDEPVLDPRTRLRLAARTLAAGVAYAGSDFRFDPPHRPRVATKPSIAVVGSGKRTGKTAVVSAMARVLAARGTPPVVVAMGRGGPAEPEVVDPSLFDLSPKGLVALADDGRHAASDHLEDALTAGVVTIGTRRCGGGLAGAPAYDNVADGVRLANERPETLVVLEGSGQAFPPVHADATLCVVPATADPELVTGYLGAYRLLLSDVLVVTMCEATPFVSDAKGAVAPRERLASLESSVRGLAPGMRLVHTVFRPRPLSPISGRRVVYATTAPAPVLSLLTDHLEREHGATVVGCSPHLADRGHLRADLEAAGEADVLVVELKAAAVDVATRVALERGMEVVFCDNQVVSVGGDDDFDTAVVGLADLATDRYPT